MIGRMAIWKRRSVSQKDFLLQVEVADTFFRRFLGLMGRKNIEPSNALLLSPCSSVHMCFMRFAIDVVYLKREKKGRDCGGWQAMKVVRSLRPWIGFSACWGADAVLELGSGEAERLGMQVGSVWDEIRNNP